MKTPENALALSHVRAEVGRDDSDHPTLVVSDGKTEFVLSSSEDDREDLAGARRIIDGIWDYQQETVARREAVMRANRLAERRGVEGLVTVDVTEARLEATAGNSGP
jgi:hypothetical protein